MLARIGLDISTLSLMDTSGDCFLKCGAVRNLSDVLRLHVHICVLGLEAYPALGNHLIFMMAEVEILDYVEQVFNRLVHKNEYSWSSLITASVRCHEPCYALKLYRMMQDSGFCTPSPFAFIALLKACAALKDLEKGSELHDVIINGGFLEMNACIGSTLVNMYSKCGALTKAHQVLDNLRVRDVVSWTALISGYVDYGYGDETLTCIETMQDEGISPNAHTLVCSLKACGIMEALEKGRVVHAGIVKKGFEDDVLIGNTLIDMYAKCGSFETAHLVFKRLLARTVVTWTVLIAGYVEHGYGEEALVTFHRMRQERIPPDASTFVCSLKACGSIGEAIKCQQLHGEIVTKGLERDLFIASATVDMYARGGFLREAYRLFDKIQNKDVVAWTTLLAGYAEYGYDMEAVECLWQMQADGVSPNAVTFVCALQACAHGLAIDKGQEIHAEIIIKGLEEELLVGSSLIDMYAKCGWLTEAQEVFDKFPARQIGLWTPLLAGYAEQGCGEKVCSCFEQMQCGGISPSAVAFVCCLKACGGALLVMKGQELHAEIVRRGFDREPLVGNTLVHMYIKFTWLMTARSVFDKLPIQAAVSWNTIIGGYVDHEHREETLHSFDKMKFEGIACMNTVTFVCSLKACSSLGAPLKGLEIHAEIIKRGLEQELIVGNASMDMYAKCGLITEAQKVFDRLLVHDAISWNVLISAYAQLGKCEHVFSSFSRMIREGVQPDLVTLVNVVNGCSHAGLVKEGLLFFEAFSSIERGFVPTLEHYNCLVDLLGRGGHIDKAVFMIMKMPFHPDIVVWHTVLAACRNWGDVLLGRHAFDRALKFDARDPTLYICMCSIYLQAALPEEAKKVEQMRAESRG